jgi:Class II Aldolase and Adducin N-terminal domain
VIDEGYIKFDLEWIEAEPPTEKEVADLREWRRPLYAAGLIGHYTELNVGYGNISVRSGSKGEFIISGTQTGHLADPDERHYARVTAYDIDANRVTCRGAIRASSESMTHAAIYELSPAINAIVHVHSAGLWRRLLHVLPTTAADVAYGTPQMAAEFRRLYRETPFSADGIAIMAGHEEGIIGTGHGMAEATRRIMQLCDHD